MQEKVVNISYIYSLTNCCLLLYVYTSVQQLLSSHVRYDVFSINSGKRLKAAVKGHAYPPAIKYIVQYRKELRRTGRSTEVTLHISGMNQSMEFPYKAYERTQGSWSIVSLVPASIAVLYTCMSRSVMC